MIPRHFITVCSFGFYCVLAGAPGWGCKPPDQPAPASEAGAPKQEAPVPRVEPPANQVVPEAPAVVPTTPSTAEKKPLAVETQPAEKMPVASEAAPGAERKAVVVGETVATDAQASVLGLKDLAGDWLGVLDAKQAKLRISMHVRVKDDGKVEATFDSLDQGASGLPITLVKVEKGEFRVESELVHATYSGKMAGRDRLEGTWKQGSGELPFRMDRTAAPVVLQRPQEPKPPFPYTEHEVLIDRSEAGVTLAGTLTVPKAAGPVPAVLLVSGSGLQDRNEAIMGHKPFLVLADHLTRAGIAVLRVDDRGIGGSKGDVQKATSLDFAQDAKAEWEFLRQRPEVDPKRVGLVGHSEGAIIAGMLASAMPEIAFIVLLAGPGINGEQIVVRQVEVGARGAKMVEAEVLRLVNIQKEFFKMLATVPEERLRKEMKEFLLLEAVPKEVLAAKTTEGIQARLEIDKALDRQVEGALSPWFKFFIKHDPAKDLEKVKCPVLALVGELDTQVDADVNLEAVDAALKRGGASDVTTRKLPGLNHLFQTAKTGLVAEYVSIEETFQPQALELVSGWILQHTLALGASDKGTGK